MRCRLTRDYRFEAAHFLPRVPEGHKCRRMHGHSYQVRVTIEGEVDPELGWLIDFADVDEVVDPVLAALDHRVLNDLPGLENPTSEVLAMYLWGKLAGRLPLSEVEVAETADSRCAVRGG
ncbi:MAG TPA: 6-carboxytetrahydropterin synthase QueD [Kofleriaceae bacterium]|nr:6-carboxytetrahydropterin synthase QueD [Kofleriaceae bacterium]